jgi:hypothetical protein
VNDYGDATYAVRNVPLPRLGYYNQNDDLKKCGIREAKERQFLTMQSKRIKQRKRQRTLQHVDIIELQAFQAFLHRIKDVLPALAILVHVAEAVGILRTPQKFPRIIANREV